MIYYFKKKQAFTLVELIVVVTILAILSTIGFVSYSGYLTGVRDTNRISSLTAISDGLELYRTRNDLPLPDDSVEVKIEGTTIARQGYVGKNVLQTIEYSKSGKDPKDDSYYSYYLTDDNKYYQLMAFLEESDQLEVNNNGPLSPLKERGQGELRSKRGYSGVFKREVVHAATNYSNRHPKVYGKRLGILTDTDNTPIQEISNISLAGELDIVSGSSTGYISRYSDEEVITASGSALLSELSTNSSCKRIKQINSSSRSGIYTINPNGQSEISVYCDMQTDGGGWTLILKEKNGNDGNFTSSDSVNNCISWENNEQNFCRKKYGFDFDNIMIAAFKNVSGYEGEYRSIIYNIEAPVKDYFKNGVQGTSIYEMQNSQNDFITSVPGYQDFAYTPSRIYKSSGFYFNQIGQSHSSILVNTHTNADCDRVVVTGHSTTDTDSIIGLFVK